MPALDLSSLPNLPYVAWTVTTATHGFCREVILPTYPCKLTISNRDKATKDLAISTDQTLTDGGAAPANQFFTVTNHTFLLPGENRITGIKAITKLFLFSPTHDSLNAEIIVEEGEL